MKNRELIAALTVVGLAAAAGAGIAYRAQSEPDEDGDVQVTLGQCPEAVQATIRQYVGDGTINEIEKSPAGKYEVDATGSNGQFEFVVAGTGTYLGPEEDDDGPDGEDDRN
jgi:hypothetical protein